MNQYEFEDRLGIFGIVERQVLARHGEIVDRSIEWENLVPEVLVVDPIIKERIRIILGIPATEPHTWLDTYTQSYFTSRYGNSDYFWFSTEST